MNYLHLTEDDDGVSHFSDAEIGFSLGDFAPPAPPMYLSETEPASGVIHLILPVGWTGDWHPSPRRQIAYCLAGTMRLEAGDGEIRDIGPGGIWRMEDITGRGHRSSVTGDRNAELVIVQL